jgi:hypothetical protein
MCPTFDAVLTYDGNVPTIAVFIISFQQLRFQKMNGVARCAVGYSGGVEPSPNYRSIKVQVGQLEVFSRYQTRV